jgi:hypothetical protein
MTPCPFKIIQAAIAAHTVFVQENENKDRFNAGDIEAHRNLLIMWCLAVEQESIHKTRYSLLPDNNDLKKHKVNAHRKYIQLPSKQQQQPQLTQPKQWMYSGNLEPPWCVQAKQQRHKMQPNKNSLPT